MPYFFILLQALLGLTVPPQPRFEAQTIDSNVAIELKIEVVHRQQDGDEH